jgi:cysteine protease ATG4
MSETHVCAPLLVSLGCRSQNLARDIVTRSFRKEGDSRGGTGRLVNLPRRRTTDMEAAISGAAAEVGRAGRRLIQRIFDPEPVNRAALSEPVWCLGRSYKPDVHASGRQSISANDSHHSAVAPSQLQQHHSAGEPTPPPEFGVEAAKEEGVGHVDTPPESVPDSLDSSVVAVDEEAMDTGWPVAFLDDFESRIWMTYRSAFSIIAKSQDPRAVHALSFAMRLRTSFGEHTGFSSDTGWGCMIRSGQSLLANAISFTRLGRGT